MNSGKLQKILYWLSTGVIFLLLGWSVFGYVFLHDMMAGFFIKFGYPTYIIYPLAGLKLLALLILITNKYNNLKEMVYGAYFINMLLATSAHMSVGDTPYHAYLGLIALITSYALSNKVSGKPVKNLFA